MTTPRNDASWAADPLTGRSLEEEMAIQIERGHADGAGFLDGLSDEDRAEFALALEVQAELEAQDATAGVPGVPDAAGSEPTLQVAPAPEPGVIPLRRPEPRPRRLSPQWVALAAVLAGVMLLPFAWRTMQGGAVRYPSQAVAMLENPAAGLPADWVNQTPPWGQTRGGGDSAADQARSVRLGMNMVQLELAIRARNAAETELLADRAALLLGNVTAGGLVTPALRQIKEQAGGDPSALLPQVEEANETAASLLEGDWFSLGAWAEAARLAAARQEVGFFREARTRGTLDRAEELVGDNEEARTAITSIRASLEGDAPDWARLVPAVNQLLAEIG